MSSSRGLDAARTYVRWSSRHLLSIVGGAVALLAASVYLIAFHLPLKADFSHLLPQDAASVRDLRRLEARVSAQDTALVVIDAADPATRAAAVDAMIETLARLPASLVDHVEHDDSVTREFLRAHRHLFVPLPDLVRARDALRARIDAAKLAANPLFIDLDDEPAADAKDAEAELAKLRERRREAEAFLNKPGRVGENGTRALIVVRTAFAKTDARSGKALIAALERARAEVMTITPGAQIGFTGGVVNSVVEHEALLRGIVASSVVTAVLVGLVLILYFRSLVMLGLLGFALITGTTASFGFAAIAVGHLNAATAFLGAIIAGNGVNYGLLLLARFLEERRDMPRDEAMAHAIHGTLRPTIVASLGAAIAYGSLAATSFRGFADFAIIGAVGMILCWIATYVMLPALVLRFVRQPKRPPGESRLGNALARIFGFQRPGVVCAVAGVLTIAAVIVTYRYIAADPFEYDIKNLRSEGADAIESRAWLKKSDATFGRGISGQTYIAADRRDQVPMIVEALKRVDDGLPDDRRTIGTVRSILDVVPPQQAEKLAVLAEIRAMLTDEVLAELPEADRAEIAALRPPADLQPITIESLPRVLSDQLRERNGTVGLLIGVRPADTLDEWDGRALIRFSDAVRRVQLPDGETVTTSGSSVIFADIVAAIQNDGPVVTLLATLGLLVMVVLVVGRNIGAIAVMTATLLGSLALVAVCALIDLKVNFLDFVALPITLGLGIDYAINVAHRHRSEDQRDPRETLRTSGSAVLLCSLTTIIGYGSLLVSENLAIRGFGVASLIGEVACLLTALIVVPAILSLSYRPHSGVPPEVVLGDQPPLARP
jgi:predicted RND superfamily exporter protein